MTESDGSFVEKLLHNDIFFSLQEMDPVRLGSKPAECPNDANFCGGDDDTYPHQLINVSLFVWQRVSQCSKNIQTISIL